MMKLAAIHTTSSQKKGKQHTVAESSNKNDKVYDVVNANQTSCDGSLSHKLDDTFRYEAGSVEHVMTSEEIAKKKEDEEIIKRKNEENKASHAEVMRVIEEEARSLQIQKNSATRAEEDKQLEIKYKNRKLRYDRYVRVVNPQCRFFLKKITVVDILSRKGPFSVMVFGEGFLNMKVHNPLNLCDFNYDEWMEIRKCMVTKTSKQAKIILENIKYRVKELSEIEKSLGLVSGVPLSELDPMIEYHGILNKRKLDDIEKEGSFVSGMDCDLSIPLELVNKDLVDGHVLYEPKFGMFFKNRCNKCDSIGVIRTSWTPGNPGRRFYCCSKRGSNHGFIDWCDEETCQCSVLIIKQLEDEVAEIRAKKGRMKMMLIFSWVFSYFSI
ncbi:zinc finger, GRF-type containing protein [Tanacetum coccineum]